MSPYFNCAILLLLMFLNAVTVVIMKYEELENYCPI